MIGRRKHVPQLRIAARGGAQVVRWHHGGHKYEIVHVLQAHDEDSEALAGSRSYLATSFRTFLLRPRVFDRLHAARNAELIAPPGSANVAGVLEDVLEVFSAEGANYREEDLPPHLEVRGGAGGSAGLSISLSRGSSTPSHRGTVSFVGSTAGGSRQCACCDRTYIVP